MRHHAHTGVNRLGGSRLIRAGRPSVGLRKSPRRGRSSILASHAPGPPPRAPPRPEVAEVERVGSRLLGEDEDDGSAEAVIVVLGVARIVRSHPHAGDIRVLVTQH